MGGIDKHRMLNYKEKIISDPGVDNDALVGDVEANPPTITNPSAENEDGYIDMGRINPMDEYTYPRKK